MAVHYEILAKIAFDAYNKSTGGKTWDGRDIPTWEEIKAEKPSVTNAWIAAAKAVADAIIEEALI